MKKDKNLTQIRNGKWSISTPTGGNKRYSVLFGRSLGFLGLPMGNMSIMSPDGKKLGQVSISDDLTVDGNIYDVLDKISELIDERIKEGKEKRFQFWVDLIFKASDAEKKIVDEFNEKLKKSLK
ncbi:MAG: hypothetical protein GF353_10780 [Candidatus Lokiarchaeota archaeon]|nr:hypothetical protein [Candidatus Lokiarchaeota archaeon]